MESKKQNKNQVHIPFFFVCTGKSSVRKYFTKRFSLYDVDKNVRTYDVPDNLGGSIVNTTLHIKNHGILHDSSRF